MKTLLRRFAPFVLLAFLASCAGWQSTTFKAAGTANVTVQTLMAAWNDYIPVGHPTLDQERKVKALYEKCQAAELLVIDSAVAYSKSQAVNAADPNLPKFQAAVSTAIAIAAADTSDLLNLLRSFGVKV